MDKIERIIKKTIEKQLFSGKVLILYGPRQVGKTTLVQQILAEYSGPSEYFSCDEPDVRAALTDATSSALDSFFGDTSFVVIDEAQRVKNIGLTLKLLIDTQPDRQIIATGSSSFELANTVVEPLTGRSIEHHLFPLSIEEMQRALGEREMHRRLESLLVTGGYPEAVATQGDAAQAAISRITQSYAYKDILSLDQIRNSEVLEKLLQALALQLGNEVSFNELAQLVGVDKVTVQKYVRVLEQAFIVFRLSPFSRNKRNELKRLRKIFFYDVGLRNALLNDFRPLNLRTDVGSLWENLMVVERMKYNAYHGRSANLFFWRTHAQQEIDLIEESNGQLRAFEFKWKQKKWKAPGAFTKSYPDASVELIHSQNYSDFVGIKTE